ncbi:MAG TPA: BREX system P-loop protein BrxC, partial [Candidatus Wallbacteria bacterium]|nr:BREX system P-loop protein BrxC [Candidatus Wallbacteria bacterium]
QKDITRNINGVIKVGQDDSENIFQELDEYVITKELDKIFHKFYESYASSLQRPTDKIGVWISGFFGSGKSHLLKILSYLLENCEAKGKKALDFFKDKVADQMLYGQMKVCSQSSSDVILFNIDSKADSDSKSKKDAIVSVFLKVFNEKCGYCGELPQVAEFERMLDGEGKYEEFKKVFAQVHKESWVESRSSFFLIQDEIVESLIKAFSMTSESAHRWLDKLDDWYKESINKFAELVSKHIKAKGKNHRVIFLVDEVGQYIADNPNLMLNLQTVIEDLGIKCGGNAWVIVTAQDDIDSLVGRIRDMDFSKIQGRFNTRLNLSSANTDEVIKKRLLTKKVDAVSELTEIYKEKEPTLKSQLCFSQNTTVELKNYSSAEDFVTAYPFVPYQFTLLQRVFEAIRRTGASGKHLSQGERSMLDSFQVAACVYKDRTPDILVPFYTFYSAIEGFLDAAIKRVITQAAGNSKLQDFDVKILKTLFMIKYIKEIKPNIDNITTLSCSEIDQDKLLLRKNIEAALDRLEKQTLIQRNNDEYYFLTDEEQDVSREIKKVTYDEREVTNYINDLMWNEVYADKKYRYKNIKDYSFNRMVDDVAHGHQQNDITIKIITPHHDDYQLFNDLKCLYETADNSTLLIKIPRDSFFIDEISEMLKTEKYIKTKNSMTLPDSIKKILESKAQDNTNRKTRIKNMLVGLVAGADYFVCNEKFEVKLKDVKTAINNALEKLITNVYTKLSYITLFLKDEKDI